MSQQPMRAGGDAEVARPRGLSWSEEASDSHRLHATRYEATLKSFSESFARFYKSEYVIENHVLEGHGALARCGLNAVGWFGRPEISTAFGGALFGAAFSISDTISLFFEEAPWKKAFGGGAFVALVIIGAVFFLLGLQSARPISYRSIPERLWQWWKGDGSTSNQEKSSVAPMFVGILVIIGVVWLRDHQMLTEALSKAKQSVALGTNQPPTAPAVSGTLHTEQVDQAIAIRGEVVVVVGSATFKYIAIPDGSGKFALAPKLEL